jgi:hypothetical protein
MNKDLSELRVGSSLNLAYPSELGSVAMRQDYSPQISPICTDFLGGEFECVVLDLALRVVTHL